MTPFTRSPQGILPASSYAKRYLSAPVELGELTGFSEAQVHFLAESLPLISWTAFPDGRVDFMNDRWFAYTGLTPKETYDESSTAVHPDDYSRYKREWEEAVKTKRMYEIEYRFRRASDGAYRWHLGRALPVRDHQGNLIKWFGTCTDIHVQKEMEEEVRRINEHLETLVESRTIHLKEEVLERRKAERKHREQVKLLQKMINMLPMAAVAADANGRVHHANKAFRALLGEETTTDEVTDHSCEILLKKVEARFPSRDWDTLFDLMKKPVSFVHELSLENGRTYLFENIPHSQEEGGFLLLTRDITEEKRVDAVKAEFMSLASHQLRTPLTGIRWALNRFGKALQGKLLPNEAYLLEKAKENAAAMSQTIRTMLSISHLETGTARTDVTTILPLKKFLLDFHARFSDTCAAKKLRFTVECAEEITVKTDEKILREILENLLLNAIKYTPTEGSVLLRGEETKEGIRIDVIDTGIGIPAHQQEKLFTKFFRAENALRMDTQGTGLGLYLVSQLVGTLGGTISFVSFEKEGSTFTVILSKEMIKA